MGNKHRSDSHILTLGNVYKPTMVFFLFKMQKFVEEMYRIKSCSYTAPAKVLRAKSDMPISYPALTAVADAGFHQDNSALKWHRFN